MLEEIRELQRKLVKLNSASPDDQDNEQLADILNRLKDMFPGIEGLRSTGIGKLINLIRRRSTSEDVKEKAAQVMKRWKEGVAGSSLPKAKAKSKGEAAEVSKNQKSKQEEKTTSTNQDNQTNMKPTPSLKIGSTDNKTRNKIQKLLYEALGACPPALQITETDTTVATTLAGDDIAIRIEQSMFDKFSQTGKEYGDTFRNIKFNLADKANPSLNYNLFYGKTQAESLVNMNSDELADDSLKELREANDKYNVDAARSDYDGMSGATDIFQCEKCMERTCKYFQQQTRGADEPMTVFVTCLLCGHKWRDGDNDGD